MSEDVHAARRARVLESMGPSSVLVVFSAPLALRNNDVEHEYRQDSDFYYLSGFDEPESVLVLSTVRAERYTLFVRPRDPERETWDGPRAGVDGATKHFGADAAHPIAELAGRFPDYLENAERLHYRLGRVRSEDDRILDALDRARAKARRGSSYPLEIADPAGILHEMRRLKEPGEIELMVRAADITKEAHVLAMSRARAGTYEYELEALLRGVFRQSGSERPAYAPIVGSGPNATVLHHRRNDRRMEDGELVLIDAGCELGYYASDVTRTFPVSGTFSGPQRALYDLVLEAQSRSIEATRPGATLDDVHRESVRVITQGLIDLGFIQGPLDTAMSEERFKPYYMHKTSHYLGMDVHDVGQYFVRGKHRPLEPNVVITVEPGIYVPASDAAAPPEYRGIGIRIEDDVLVTPDGRRVLSESIPRSPADVELACRS